MNLGIRCAIAIGIVVGAGACPTGGQVSPSETGVLAKHVLRVQCQSSVQLGTAFVHKSGLVVTASHVVASCSPTDLRLVDSLGKFVSVKSAKVDTDIDLALLTPQELFAPGLKINQSESLVVGTTLAIWGFPSGYGGEIPLLTVGYLSGTGVVANPKPHKRLLVNAAFNSGNSGGPVIETASMTVVGIVNAKLTPIPQEIEAALGALELQSTGQTYTVTRQDGSTTKVTEAQLVASVLHYLRSQTQLVLGTAVLSTDLNEFLRKNGVEP